MLLRRLPVAIALILAPAAAHAGDALKIELVPKALAGQGEPALVVKAEAPLKKLLLDVRRSTDGKSLRLGGGPVGAGRTHRFALAVDRPGKASFSGTLKVELDNGETGEMPINVDVELLPPLEVKIAPEDVDIEGKKLKLVANRAIKRVQISLMSDSGTPLGTTEKDWGGELQPEGQKHEIVWNQSKGTLMKITVQAYDADEFFGAVDLFPWQVDIPHEEVNFASGSSEIPQSEAGKLEASFKLIKAAIAKYGKLATIRLFVAGHTDTVSDAAYNRTLSNDRARALGRWFSKKGAGIPIQYTGFGEDRLLVQTPDNTDEPKNRRAEYIVAVDPPRLSGSVRWQPL